MAGKEQDWITPVAIVGGGAALVVGAYMLLKGKTVVNPGDSLEVTFKFKYRGPSANHLLRVTAGYLGWTGIDFYENNSARMEYPITIEGSYNWENREFIVQYDVPSVNPEDRDLEFSIRYADGSIVPDMRAIIRDVLEV